MEQKWKRFEKLVYSIQKSLTPNSRVEYDYRVLGKNSCVERQVDIAIFDRIGQFEFFIAMDCKDYNKPIDVKNVEEFKAMLEDIDADRGVLVTFKGASQAAKNVAKKAKIELLIAVDTESDDWPIEIYFPVVFEVRRITKFNVEVSGSYNSPMTIPNVHPKFWLIYNNKQKPLGIIYDLISRRWSDLEFYNKTGVNSIWYKDIRLNSDATFYRTDIKVNYIVETDYYYGDVKVAQLKGFVNEKDGQLYTNEVVTEPLALFDFENKWKRISKSTSKSIDEVLRIVAFGELPKVYEMP